MPTSTKNSNLIYEIAFIHALIICGKDMLIGFRQAIVIRSTIVASEFWVDYPYFDCCFFSLKSIFILSLICFQ